MARSIQFSSDSGSRRWAATFTRSGPNGPSVTTGTAGSPVVKPALGPGLHCMATRTAPRPSTRWSSPRPISSPYSSTGLPGRVNSRL